MTTSKAAAYPPALRAILPEAEHVAGKAARQAIERGRQRLKGRIRRMRGFKSAAGAAVFGRAHGFVRNLREGSYRLGLVPGDFLSEPANALYQYVRVQGPGIANISLADAQSHLGLLADLVALVGEDLALLQHAQQLAAAAQRPATYDDCYAALALRRGGEFWTANERYWNAVRHLCPWVRCVADPALQLGPAAQP